MKLKNIRPKSSNIRVIHILLLRYPKSSSLLTRLLKKKSLKTRRRSDEKF